MTKIKTNENIETNMPIMVGKIPGTNWLDIMQRVYSPKGISPTIHTCGGGQRELKIVVSEHDEKSNE